MAELATIARPYAEALFKSEGAATADAVAQLDALAAVAHDPQMRAFASIPGADAEQVFDLLSGVAGTTLAPTSANLLRAVIENGRLEALPEIAAQFKTLVNGKSGVSDAIVQSAFPIDSGALAEVVASLEQRFGRKLKAQVEIEPALIGGIRVVVGDEVLDTSVKARLEQMKVALTA